MGMGNNKWAAAASSSGAQGGNAGARKRLMRTVPVGTKFAIVIGSVIVPLVALIAVGAFTFHADTVAQEAAHTASGEALRPLYTHYRHLMLVALLVTGLTLAVSIWLTVAVSRRFSGAVTRLRVIAGRITDGKYDNIIDKEGDDEVSMLYASTARMQELLGEQEAERARAGTEMARLQGGLNAASTNVMIADMDNRIVYMNDSVTKLFRDIETDLRKDLPRFDVKNLLGENIDVFHKNPAYQQHMLADLRQPHTANILVGGRSMRFIASPILDGKGQRTGTVVEWIDRTADVANEKEIQRLVSAVIAGDLSARVKEEGNSTQIIVAKGLNTLVESVGDVVAEVDKLVTAANDGDLSRRLNFEGKVGLSRKMGHAINTLVERVSSVVEEVQKLVGAASAGDLTYRIAVQGNGGLFERVGGGVNGLVESMAGVIAQVKDAASEVSRGADEISQGNTNLSQRTEEQALSLEETASSMEEMTSTVKQNADNAGHANQLAVAARDQAEKGGAVVASAVRAMTEINESSKKIADIIGVIDEIAFQTNLLALNAAVEAARAGEQGRGFAVVATEVRNLAGRAATAAKEIKGLIQDSVRKVDEGSVLVTQSGVTLQQIVGAVKKVTDIVAEIAAASQEQSAGIDQVNRAVMQLDELTQQNAALVEEASAASQSMAEQARTLNESMARYRVAGGGSARANPPATRSAAPPKAERRASPNRPWTSKAKAAAAPARAGAASAAAASEADWSEF
jgi:methyl-accepting chemotaxis protein